MKSILMGIAVFLVTTAFCQDDTTWNRYAVEVSPTIYKKPPPSLKHEFGALSIGTNLTALFRNQPYNSRLTVEPEYQLSDHISVKLPMVIGLFRTRIVGQRTGYFGMSPWDKYEVYDFDANTIPEFRLRPKVKNWDDIIVQAGINPKYYINGKSKNLLSFYGSAAFNVGLADQYSYRGYDRMDSVDYYNWELEEYETGWTVEEGEVEFENHEFAFFNYELLIGMDYNFSRRLSATIEMGYSSPLYGRPARQDILYTAIFDEEYQVNFEGALETYGRKSLPFRTRIFLSYRF